MCRGSAHAGKEFVQKGDTNMKHFVAAGIAGATLALAISFGSASAAPASAPTAQQSLTTAQPSASSTTSPAPGSRRGGLHGGKESLIRATASVTGLTLAQVRTELGAGKSLAEIIKANGKTVNDVVHAARAEYQSALNQSVASGRLTQAQADARLAEFDQSAPQVVNDATLGQRLRGGCAPGDTTGAAGRAQRNDRVRIRT